MYQLNRAKEVNVTKREIWIQCCSEGTNFSVPQWTLNFMDLWKLEKRHKYILPSLIHAKLELKLLSLLVPYRWNRREGVNFLSISTRWIQISMAFLFDLYMCRISAVKISFLEVDWRLKIPSTGTISSQWYVHV